VPDSNIITIESRIRSSYLRRPPTSSRLSECARTGFESETMVRARPKGVRTLGGNLMSHEGCSTAEARFAAAEQQP